MRLSDLPLHYQKQVALKLANGGIRAPLSSLSTIFGNKSAATKVRKVQTRPWVNSPVGTDCGQKSRKKPNAGHSMPPPHIDVVCVDAVKGKYGHLDFTLKVNPRKIPTAQQKGCDPRTGRFFRKKHILAWENRITDTLKSLKAEADGVMKPYDLRLGFIVEVIFSYPFPSDYPKKERENRRPMTKRPDVDNAAKMLIDCVSRSGLLPDDAPIYRLVLNKFYTLDEPSIYIHLARNY